MSLYIHTLTTDPIFIFLEEAEKATETYEVDTHIEEFVREELINTLRFIACVYKSETMKVSEELYSEVMSIYVDLCERTSWEGIFESEKEFLTFLRTVCDLRDTFLNSLLYMLIKSGVHPDKANLALQNLIRAYDISNIDLQHRQLTAPRY